MAKENEGENLDKVLKEADEVQKKLDEVEAHLGKALKPGDDSEYMDQLAEWDKENAAKKESVEPTGDEEPEEPVEGESAESAQAPEKPAEQPAAPEKPAAEESAPAAQPEAPEKQPEAPETQANEVKPPVEEPTATQEGSVQAEQPAEPEKSAEQPVEPEKPAEQVTADSAQASAKPAEQPEMDPLGAVPMTDVIDDTPKGPEKTAEAAEPASSKEPEKVPDKEPDEEEYEKTPDGRVIVPRELESIEKAAELGKTVDEYELSKLNMMKSMGEVPQNAVLETKKHFLERTGLSAPEKEMNIGDEDLGLGDLFAEEKPKPKSGSLFDDEPVERTPDGHEIVPRRADSIERAAKLGVTVDDYENARLRRMKTLGMASKDAVLESKEHFEQRMASEKAAQANTPTAGAKPAQATAQAKTTGQAPSTAGQSHRTAGQAPKTAGPARRQAPEIKRVPPGTVIKPPPETPRLHPQGPPRTAPLPITIKPGLIERIFNYIFGTAPAQVGQVFGWLGQNYYSQPQFAPKVVGTMPIDRYMNQTTKQMDSLNKSAKALADQAKEMAKAAKDNPQLQEMSRNLMQQAGVLQAQAMGLRQDMRRVNMEARRIRQMTGNEVRDVQFIQQQPVYAQQYGAPVYRGPAPANGQAAKAAVQKEKSLDPTNADSRAAAGTREAKGSQELRGNKPEVKNPQPAAPKNEVKKPEVTLEQKRRYIAEKKRLLDKMSPEQRKEFRAKEVKNMTQERKKAMELLKDFRMKNGKNAPLPKDLEKQLKDLLSKSTEKEILARKELLAQAASKKAPQTVKGQAAKPTAPKQSKKPKAQKQTQQPAAPANKPQAKTM